MSQSVEKTLHHIEQVRVLLDAIEDRSNPTAWIRRKVEHRDFIVAGIESQKKILKSLWFWQFKEKKFRRNVIVFDEVQLNIVEDELLEIKIMSRGW